MKSVYAAGAIAGLVGGIVGVIFYIIGGMLGLIPVGPENIILLTIRFIATRILGLPVDAVLAVINIIVTIIFGAIFGMIYSKFYDSIPGKDITKGLYFGLMIWFIKDIAAGVYVALMGGISFAIQLIFVGFFMWIVYGPIISKLYTK
ncbi:hypothetical protein [[Eubacterium] cellulosolvens]